jgi:hypothetical protein
MNEGVIWMHEVIEDDRKLFKKLFLKGMADFGVWRPQKGHGTVPL